MRRSSSRSARAGSRLLHDRIDLSVLNLVDADLTFRAPIFAHDKVLIEKPDLNARFKNGVLTVPVIWPVVRRRLRRHAESWRGPARAIDFPSRAAWMASTLRNPWKP